MCHSPKAREKIETDAKLKVKYDQTKKAEKKAQSAGTIAVASQRGKSVIRPERGKNCNTGQARETVTSIQSREILSKCYSIM